MIRTPQQLMKEIVLPKAAEGKLSADEVNKLMTDTWVAEYVPLKFYETVATSTVEPKKESSPTPAPSSSSGIDSLWGDDMSSDDFGEFMGGVDTDNSTTEATPSSGTTVVTETSELVHLNPHISEQLTNTQLQRVGFSGGGLVITFLNSQLDAEGTEVKIGSQITFGGRTYRVIEAKQLLYWEYLKGQLYTVANCEE